MNKLVLALSILLTYPAGHGFCAPELGTPARKALIEALNGKDGEYASLERYKAIVQKHGDVLPYARIAMSEQQHINMLEEKLREYGMEVPPNPFSGKVTAPETLAEAAELGVRTEKENVSMYDRLMKDVSAAPDIKTVFEHLRFASAEHHLFAFTRAKEMGGSMGGGMGAGARGKGRGPGMGRGSGASSNENSDTSATMSCCGMGPGHKNDGNTSGTASCCGMGGNDGNTTGSASCCGMVAGRGKDGNTSLTAAGAGFGRGKQARAGQGHQH